MNKNSPYTVLYLTNGLRALTNLTVSMDTSFLSQSIAFVVVLYNLKINT